jgi:hypothetical protein
MSLEKRDQSRKVFNRIEEQPCEICGTLKEFQSDCVDNLNNRMPRTLCNLHTWLIAKVAEAGTAADVLLRMLELALEDSSAGAECSFCAWIADEEDKKLAEFARKLNKPEFLLRLRDRGGLCIPHARKLVERVPPNIRDQFIPNLQRHAAELRRDLVTLSRNAKAGMTIHPGLLGRAAEYLVAKRGFSGRLLP